MNNTQLAVRCTLQSLFVLEQHGYKNVQNLTIENYSFPVVIVELPSKTFFGTNTACMAAMKPKVIEVEDLIKRLP